MYNSKNNESIQYRLIKRRLNVSFSDLYEDRIKTPIRFSSVPITAMVMVMCNIAELKND